MTHCIDEKIGELITQYELGQLSQEENNRFENHLKECSFCRYELKEMEPIVSRIRQHKDQLIRKLHDEGVCFETAREELLSSTTSRTAHQGKDHWSIRRFFDNLMRPKVYVPAAATAVVILALFLALPSTNRQEKLPYPLRPPFAGESDLLLRDYSLIEGEQLFRKGISDYASDNYKGAIGNLKKAVEKKPENGEWWLYLGVSYYLDGQTKNSIDALTKADSLISQVYRPHIKWYLAQAYLHNGDHKAAIELLEWIRKDANNSIYANKASLLLSEVSKKQ